MRTRSLLNQVLAVNAGLVAATAAIALLVPQTVQGMILIGTAVVAALLLNSLMLKRRLVPLETLLETLERVDPTSPGQRAATPASAPHEVKLLTAGFNRMLARLEEERVEGGRAVIRAQEEERARIAQDLHDEVNQALTAILLRLEALAQDAPPARAGEVTELKRLVNQAMEELLNLARHLRPTALDDHGLMPALETQLKRFSARTGVEVRLNREGDPDELPEDVQTALYRVTQEALANVARHAGATVVEVDIEVADRIELRVRDDGAGFHPGTLARRELNGSGGSGLGLGGMAERARLAGGELDVRSAPGGGTTVTMRIGRPA